MNPEIMKKLDAPLTEICMGNQLDESSTLPIIIRASKESLPDVSAAVVRAGGRVRHHLHLFGAIAAWLPVSGIGPIGQLPMVTSLELEQEFSIA